MAHPLLLLLAACLCACYQAKPSEVAGGGGVETTEGNLAGLPGQAAGARVSMIPVDFDARRGSLPESLTTMADANGAYRFHGLKPGRYNLEVWQPKDGAGVFKAGLLLRAGSLERVGTDSLQAPGRLRLRWDGARKGVLVQRGRVFQRVLAGLESDSGGTVLDSLPAGVLPPISYAEALADTSLHAWTDSVTVAPGIVSNVLAYAEWAHQARLGLVTGTGALAGDTLIGYPLLVRLAKPAFDFTQCNGDGSDLRFTAVNGDPLAFAIEHWDANAGRAEIWVRLPALRASGAGQALLMHWGNPSATALRDDRFVFDTATGNVGVWHMADASPGKKSLQDATPNALPTLAKQLVPDGSDVAGIGVGQAFDGTGAYAYAQDTAGLIRNGPVMLSIWIAPGFDGTEPGPRALLAKWEENDSAGYILGFPGAGKGLRLTLGVKPAGGGANQVHRIEGIPAGSVTGAWHLASASFDGNEAVLYWDGTVLARETIGPAAVPATARDIVIGARGDADPNRAEVDFFLGRMDEARVGRMPRSASWIGLDYASQRPGSLFLDFRNIK